MSDSFQPQGLYCSWNSPGQNTGVGSLSLLQAMFLTQEMKWGSPALQVNSLSAKPSEAKYHMRCLNHLRLLGESAGWPYEDDMWRQTCAWVASTCVRHSIRDITHWNKGVFRISSPGKSADNSSSRCHLSKTAWETPKENHPAEPSQIKDRQL